MNSGLTPELADKPETSTPPNITMDAKIVIAITSIDQTEDSKPTETPERINVAGPVSADFFISFTGAP